MKNGKDTKPREMPSRDSEIKGFNYDEFFSNCLSLDPRIQADLKEKGLSWRFISAAQFRQGGNYHRSHWRPMDFRDSAEKLGLTGSLSTEGNIVRGDLILAVRTSEVSAGHKRFLAERNRMQAQTNKEHASALKKAAAEAGIRTKVYEGFEDNE